MPRRQIYRQEGKSDTLLCISQPKKGYINLIDLVLQAGIDVSSLEDAGLTALHVASMHEQCQSVEHLLSYLADVSAKDNLGWTPLHSASRNGYVKVVHILLAAKAVVDARSKFRRTSLYLASYWGHSEVVLTLLEANAPFIRDDLGWSVLHAAATSGKLTFVYSCLFGFK